MREEDVEKIIKQNMMVQMNLAGIRTDFEKALQREWVGLTQQDIDIAFDDTQEGGGFDDFARAIEARLKEKNHG